MIKLLNSKSGMTLVEVLVGMLVFAILATCVTWILIPITKFYTQTNDLSETNLLLDNLSDQMLDDLWGAIDVAASGTSLTIRTNADTVVYDIGIDENEGLLCKDERPIFERKYYKGKTINLEYLDTEENPISGTAPSAFIIRITLLSDGTAVESRDYAAKPLVLNSYD